MDFIFMTTWLWIMDSCLRKMACTKINSGILIRTVQWTTSLIYGMARKFNYTAVFLFDTVSYLIYPLCIHSFCKGIVFKCILLISFFQHLTFLSCTNSLTTLHVHTCHLALYLFDNIYYTLSALQKIYPIPASSHTCPVLFLSVLSTCMVQNITCKAVILFFTACFFCSLTCFKFACIDLVHMYNLSYKFIHNMFSSRTLPHIASCIYQLFVYLQILNRPIPLYIYLNCVTQQLFNLPGCKTIECIRSPVWVYSYLLILRFIDSVFFGLPVSIPLFKIPERALFDIFYTRLSSNWKKYQLCSKVLGELSVSTLIDFRTIIVRTCENLPIQGLLQLTCTVLGVIFCTILLFYHNLTVRILFDYEIVTFRPFSFFVSIPFRSFAFLL